MRTATKDLAGDLRQQLAELVRSRVPNARAERFVKRFYANVPPDDLLRALAMWQWAQQRTPGKPKVRVYAPRLDEHGWQSERSVVEIVNDDMPFLVDSVTAELNRQGVTVVLSTHELNAVAAHLPFVVCVNGGVVAQGSPLDIFTAPILSRTFGTEMRVVRDDETGGVLIAEAGRHGPFADPWFHHEHLHEAGIPHRRAGLGSGNGAHDHDAERTIAGVAD